LHEFLEKEFESDTARVQVFPVTQLGLIQISRQRHKESLRSQLYSCCPYCGGEGRLQSSWNLALQIQRELFRQYRATNGGDFTVILNPYLKSYLLANCLSEFSTLEAQWAIKVNFAADPNVHVENFKVVRNG
jgi:ribonuclease G